MTPEELEDNKQRREFWKWLIPYVVGAVPNLVNTALISVGLYVGIANKTQIDNADTARARIEDKLDTQHEVVKVAAEEAKVAAEETKSAVAELKTNMGKGSE